MKRKTKKALKLTAHHAVIAMNMLVQEGKIVAADIAGALKRREKLMKDLRVKISSLEKASAPMARRVASAGREVVRRARPRARKAISRAQKIARRAQGRYMASVRRLSEDARVKIREIRKQSGVDAAIKAALKMAK